jgi:hypothetical protein
MPTISETATDRDATISAIRANLRRRSGKAWSVTGGKGTAWGWITIQSPPVRRDSYDYMSAEDQHELSGLLSTPVAQQGILVPASREYRREYLERSEGTTPTALATPYWD